MENITAHEKYEKLKSYISNLGNLAVAFSGGVDSTFLLRTAHDVLGDDVLAVTVSSQLLPAGEIASTEEFCCKEKIRHIIIYEDAPKIGGFADNPPDRCYICKHHTFSDMIKIADENGIEHVADGTNTDDEGDYRPGMRALAELGVVSPLREAKLNKAEIRLLSKKIGLETWNKPSLACLASRFAYGEAITDEGLSMVDRAESFLLRLGFSQVRVRVHGAAARIEMTPEDIPEIAGSSMRDRIVRELKQYGFNYVTLDLEGYRTGSMNEVLPQRDL